MTKIIGHRGAAGIALENTIEAIQIAKKYKVDAIEIDVRKTKDGFIVLSHDRDLTRVSSSNKVISDSNLSELRSIEYYNEEHIVELHEAIAAAAGTALIIEIKEAGTARLILDILHRTQAKQIIFTSLWHDELKIVHKLRPDIPILVRDLLSPFDIVASAHNMSATGINLNAKQMNPLTYWLAKRYGLDIMVYTVDSPFIGNFLHRFYPGILICTNRPDRFAKKRSSWQKNAQRCKSIE